MDEKWKKFIIDSVKSIGQSIFDEFTKDKAGEVGDNVGNGPLVIPNEPEVIPVTTKLTGNSSRFFKISQDMYYCRDIVTTVFCNEADFVEENYTLASKSPYPSVKKGDMKGKRGISLPYYLNPSLVCYPINKNNGLMYGYKQVDVGPGWIDDQFWIKGTAPRNELGKDMRGNRSVKAGLDLWPQVCEDLGLCSFDQAYDKGWSGVLDMIVYDPPAQKATKMVGNEIPSGSQPYWIKQLPPTGSEFFTWGELLRGYNSSEPLDTIQIGSMLGLVKHILHPARVALGRINLGSGLRDKATNDRVGGREGSYHLTGRAADMSPANVSFGELYAWLVANVKPYLRECVWEDPGTSNEHVHVSVRLDPNEPQNIHKQ